MEVVLCETSISTILTACRIWSPNSSHRLRTPLSDNLHCFQLSYTIRLSRCLSSEILHSRYFPLLFGQILLVAQCSCSTRFLSANGWPCWGSLISNLQTPNCNISNGEDSDGHCFGCSPQCVFSSSWDTGTFLVPSNWLGLRPHPSQAIGFRKDPKYARGVRYPRFIACSLIWPGEVIRIQPNHLSFSSSEALEDIYGAGSKIHKFDPYFTLMVPMNRSLIAELYYLLLLARTDFRNRERHAFLRRAIAPGFSANAMADFTPTIMKYVKMFLHNIDEISRKQNGVVDISHWFQSLTFDVYFLSNLSDML